MSAMTMEQAALVGLVQGALQKLAQDQPILNVGQRVGTTLDLSFNGNNYLLKIEAQY